MASLDSVASSQRPGLEKLQCTNLPISSPSVPVVLDVYTPTSTLDNNTTLQLGTTCILICRTGGLPHGADYNYTWTCPNGPCTIGQGTNTNRDTYGDRLLLNILSYSDAGTYTCQVRLATTGQLLGMDQFTLRVEGNFAHMFIKTFHTTMSCCSVVHCGQLLFKKIQKYIHNT